jgi:hypothetical protein
MCAGLAACASRATPLQHAAANPNAPACSTGSLLHARRAMTWSEYYSEIQDRSSRRGMMVIWINPPDVRSARADEAGPNSCR